MEHLVDKRTARQRRRWRIRKRVRGTATRPRVAIYKSNVHLHLQAVDDETGTVVAAVSTTTADFRGLGLARSKNMEAARAVGGLLAKRLTEKNITAAVFDRSGYPFHGRVKAVAEALRAGQIKV